MKRINAYTNIVYPENDLIYISNCVDSSHFFPILTQIPSWRDLLSLAASCKYFQAKVIGFFFEKSLTLKVDAFNPCRALSQPETPEEMLALCETYCRNLVQHLDQAVDLLWKLSTFPLSQDEQLELTLLKADVYVYLEEFEDDRSSKHEMSMECFLSDINQLKEGCTSLKIGGDVPYLTSDNLKRAVMGIKFFSLAFLGFRIHASVSELEALCESGYLSDRRRATAQLWLAEKFLQEPGGNLDRFLQICQSVIKNQEAMPDEHVHAICMVAFCVAFGLTDVISVSRTLYWLETVIKNPHLRSEQINDAKILLTILTIKVQGIENCCHNEAILKRFDVQGSETGSQFARFYQALLHYTAEKNDFLAAAEFLNLMTDSFKGLALCSGLFLAIMTLEERTELLNEEDAHLLLKGVVDHVNGSHPYNVIPENYVQMAQRYALLFPEDEMSEHTPEIGEEDYIVTEMSVIKFEDESPFMWGTAQNTRIEEIPNSIVPFFQKVLKIVDRPQLDLQAHAQAILDFSMCVALGMVDKIYIAKAFSLLNALCNDPSLPDSVQADATIFRAMLEVNTFGVAGFNKGENRLAPLFKIKNASSRGKDFINLVSCLGLFHSRRFDKILANMLMKLIENACANVAHSARLLIAMMWHQERTPEHIDFEMVYSYLTEVISYERGTTPYNRIHPEHLSKAKQLIKLMDHEMSGESGQFCVDDSLFKF